MRISYKLNFPQQIISAVVTFLVAVLVTFLFDGQINWALAIGVGAFFTTGFFNRPKTQ